MAKNIVVCCDGTGNSFDQIQKDSNVAKLYSCITIDASQVCYYHPGVGTMGAQNVRWWIARQWWRLKGLAFGAGLLANVGDAYRFLMDEYADGDKIYLFGFSRGSYTVRALASLLHVFGLLCRGNHGAIPYILRMYSHRTRVANHKHVTFPVDEAFKWQFTDSRPVEIHFCGIWDTVSSYGWVYNPIKLPFIGNNPIVRTGRHAVSIDERRFFYQDNLWGQPGPGQDIRQVWFSGVHSDVGGSYLEKGSGLSKVAFEWLLVEGQKAGLIIQRAKAETILGRVPPKVVGLPHYVPPNENGKLHKSLWGPWWLVEFLPHRDPHKDGGWYLPLGRRRKIPEGSFIHELSLKSKRFPKNLPKHYQIEPHQPF